METSIKQVDGQLICQKYNHNDTIILVIMEDSVPFTDRFLCNKCLQIHRGVTKMTPINKVIDVMKEKIAIKNSKTEEQRQTSINALQQFQQKMNEIKTKTIKNFDELLRISEQWIKSLQNNMKQDDLINLFKEYEQIKETDEIEKNNKAFFIKSALIFKKMFDFKDQKNCYEELIKTIQQPQSDNIIKQQLLISQQQQQQPKSSKIIEQPQLKVSSVQLIQSVKQNEWSFAMAFNQTGTIMAAGCEQDLKIWKFQKGSLTEVKKLTRHTNQVKCIVFSKKVNWFASGSQDNTIRCWKEQNNNDWISSKIGQQHKDIVTCLILNSNEDQLISCSCDKNIIVWKVDCQKNLLDYYYTFENKHTDYVYSISLNESETSLVSCSRDKQIILWKKDSNNKWIYQSHIRNDDYGKRICFLNNTQIIWQQRSQGISHIYEIENSQLIPKPQFNIQLNKETEDDNWQFPTILNKQKQIIIQRHNKYVYILQKQEDGRLCIAAEPIDCNDLNNYGTLTIDGEYLVIWNGGTKEFRVYNLKDI